VKVKIHPNIVCNKS